MDKREVQLDIPTEKECVTQAYEAFHIFGPDFQDGLVDRVIFYIDTCVKLFSIILLLLHKQNHHCYRSISIPLTPLCLWL